VKLRVKKALETALEQDEKHLDNILGSMKETNQEGFNRMKKFMPLKKHKHDVPACDHDNSVSASTMSLGIGISAGDAKLKEFVEIDVDSALQKAQKIAETSTYMEGSKKGKTPTALFGNHAKKLSNQLASIEKFSASYKALSDEFHTTSDILSEKQRLSAFAGSNAFLTSGEDEGDTERIAEIDGLNMMDFLLGRKKEFVPTKVGDVKQKSPAHVQQTVVQEVQQDIIDSTPNRKGLI